jgi:hypothetical protein
MPRIIIYLAAGLLAYGISPSAVRAQEHPRQEHPRQEHPKKEHPKKEHPAKQPSDPARKPTLDELDAAIRQQIAEKAKATGGKFQVKDDVLNKTWSLELVRVHKEKLTPLSDTRYFACVDFNADDGTKVDVDFYMDYKDGKFSLADTTVHKINGKARFDYQQNGDLWERVKRTS